MKESNVDAFRRVWSRLARRGECDAIGGAEYYRVFLEWVRARWPRRIASFIRRRAR